MELKMSLLSRFYMVFAVVILSALNFGQGTFVSQAEWDSYKTTFNKSYANTLISESSARYYYAFNKKLINSHNALYDRGLRSYRLKENLFTDMSKHKFFALFPQTTQPSKTNASPLPPPAAQPAPTTFDPREELGLNATVSDQGTRCNSGWAYATTKSVELMQAFQTGNLSPAPLSAQNLIDCSGSIRGCDNQVPQTAFDYLTIHDMDLHLESDYKNDNTRAEPGMCVPSGSVVTNLRTYSQITDGDDATLRTYVADNYPAVIEFNPNSFEFMHYGEGIFTPDSAHSKKGSHYMTVVGYGTDSRTKMDYWLVLNSWGQTWGESGYIRIARNPKYPLAKSTLLPTELA